jgi:hypothetical protein
MKPDDTTSLAELRRNFVRRDRARCDYSRCSDFYGTAMTKPLAFTDDDASLRNRLVCNSKPEKENTNAQFSR